MQKDAEALQAQAGKKMDDLVADAKSGANKIDAKLEGYRKDAESAAKDARARASGAIDQFDRKVEEVSCRESFSCKCNEKCRVRCWLIQA